MNTQPTQQQIGLLHHALGLCPEHRKSGRNHFVAGPGHHDLLDLEALVTAGLMKRAGRPAFLRGDDIVFCVTDAGYAMAIDNLPPPPQPRKRSRYDEYLRSECCETFAEWLGIQLPEMETRLSPIGREYRYTRRRYVRFELDVVAGEWKSTLKAAKASYKDALRRAKEEA